MGIFNRIKLTRFFAISLLTLALTFQPRSAEAFSRDYDLSILAYPILYGADCTISTLLTAVTGKIADSKGCVVQVFFADPQRRPVYQQRRRLANYYY